MQVAYSHRIKSLAVGNEQIFIEVLQKLVISNCQIFTVKMSVTYLYNHTLYHIQSSILLQNQILGPKCNQV